MRRFSWPTWARCQRWQRQTRQRLGHSLRLRLMVAFVLLALGMTTVFVIGTQRALGVAWQTLARPLVSDYVDHLAADLGSPPNVTQAQALTERLPIAIRISGPQVNWHSHPGDAANDRRWGWTGDDSAWRRGDPDLLERHSADGHRIQFRLARPSGLEHPHRIGFITLGLLLLLIALAYARVRRLLRPLDDIRTGAERFGAGDFAQPIPVRRPDRPDELGVLAATINTMGQDIHHMLEAKRTLLLAISHELRSPLTRARLNTELLPETPEVDPSRAALLRDLGLMRDLVTDLLESERLASPHVALHREPLDVAELIPDVLASLDGGADVRVHLDSDRPTLNLDPARIRLLLRNLLDNALRHSPPEQPPELHLHRHGTGLRLVVRDFGPGVPPEQLAHLAQPFYRPDAARERSTGGVGLGLYLCRLVAQAHGGTFGVSNAGPGLAVAVEIPG